MDKVIRTCENCNRQFEADRLFHEDIMTHFFCCTRCLLEEVSGEVGIGFSYTVIKSRNSREMLQLKGETVNETTATP